MKNRNFSGKCLGFQFFSSRVKKRRNKVCTVVLMVHSFWLLFVSEHVTTTV